MMSKYFMPRPVHPFAWWAWAILLAATASSTTNPLLLLGIIAVACLVTFSRRGDNPWGRGFVVYLVLGAFVVVMRVAFRVLFGGGDGPTILFRLPEITLPWWVAGIRLLGPVSLESVLFGLHDGIRLAAMIICLGAANSLANPKKLLAALPGALYEFGTILVVAMGVFPQLGDSVLRVTRARKLRRASSPKGRKQKLKVVETIIVPVLSDALDRSLRLAASMDVRGYGRHGSATARQRNLTTLLGMAGLVLLSIGAYLHLTRGTGAAWLLGAGAAAVVVAVKLAGRTVTRTAYRPIRWRGAEWLVVATGAGALAIIEVARNVGQASVLAPSISPISWPTLTPLLLLALVIAALPAFTTPAPSLAGARTLTTAEGLS